MAKTLLLLRHAEAAAAAAGEDDRDRGLTPYGRQCAARVAAEIEAGWRPALVLCSPSRRTRLTLAPLHAACPDTEVRYPENLYNAAAGTLFAAAQSAPGDAGSLLIVGHNPGVHELLARLVAEARETELVKLRGQGYAPCTLSVLRCPCESWAGLAPGTARLEHVWTAR